MDDKEFAHLVISEMALFYKMGVDEYLRARARTPQAMEKAKSIGLSYWPAIAYGPRVDPVAYKVAEDHLHRKRERDGSPVPRWEQGVSHGVWDMKGDLGVSPSFVANAWQVAGYRDCALFRAQLTRKILAKPGQSLRQYKDYARGKAWADKQCMYESCRMSAKTHEALGRLSPELRVFAILGLPETGIIRTRDLNWRAVRLAQEAAKSPIPRVRAATLPAPVAAKLLGVEQEHLAGAIAPAFPNAPLALARGIAVGVKPVELASGVLTAKEAHEWLLSGAGNLHLFLEEKYGIPYHRSFRVMRWLIYLKEKNPSAFRRTWRMHFPGLPGMQVVSIRNFIQDVQDEDVRTGRDSVPAVFERALARRTRRWQRQCLEDEKPLISKPEWADRLPDGVKLLITPKELAEEGRELAHCVASYRDSVRSGQCYIFSLRTDAGRSTLELSPRFKIVQHYGPENSDPPKENIALAKSVVRILKGNTQKEK